MKFRYRVLISLALLMTCQLSIFLFWLMENQKPEYYQILEESMVETSATIAKFIEENNQKNEIELSLLQKVSEGLKQTKLNAKIYEKQKEKMEIEFYVFNQKGIVIFDSLYPQHIGKNYSQWNDVYNCLRGKYGVRTTFEKEDDENSAVLFVATPIRNASEIIGGVSVYKHAKSILPYYHRYQKKITLFGIFSLLTLLGFSVFIILWIFLPLNKLVQYSRKIQLAEENKSSNEIEQIHGKMRKVITELEAKEHIENCLQTLAHEIKAPVSVIQGAAELLKNDLPINQKEKLINNIHQENERIKKLLTNYLTLASLDAQKNQEELSSFSLLPIFNKIKENVLVSEKDAAPDIQIHCPEDLCLKGYPFLFYLMIHNLISNAIDFSHTNESVIINCTELPNEYLKIDILDAGVGLPEYAIHKIFDKFYSLKRPNNKKSTGLGLSIVHEIVQKHQGKITIENRQPGPGVAATILLPKIK